MTVIAAIRYPLGARFLSFILFSKLKRHKAKVGGAIIPVLMAGYAFYEYYTADKAGGTVSSYLVSCYGKLFFRAGVTQSPPSCSVAGDFAVDLVGPDGVASKAILAVIMTAQAAGKTVHVYVKGTCDV
jgi:hypothetical protein